MRQALVLAICLVVPLRADAALKTFPIWNGAAATSAQVYGTVAIISASDKQQSCTGTLIAPTVVLTAAHCFVEENAPQELPPLADFEIVAGPLAVDQSSATTLYTIKKIVIHPGYPKGVTVDDTGMGEDDDLALVILNETVDEVGVMPILPTSLNDKVFANGTSFIITGYGSRDQEGNLSGVLYIADTPYLASSDYEFTAGGNGKDTCPGDSGGPIYVEVEGRVYLAGVTSRGVNGATTQCGEGGIYAIANKYLQWFVDSSDGAFTIEGNQNATGDPTGNPTGNTGSTGGSGKKGCSVGDLGDQGSPATLLLFLCAFAAFVIARRRVTTTAR